MSNPSPSPEPTPTYRRFRAPQADGHALIDPPGAELIDQLHANRAWRESLGQSFLGLDVAALADEARRELLGQAYSFTSAFCDVDTPGPAASSGPLIVSGHQPELFHPGVWFKNLALDAIARRAGGVGVHVLIDSDLCRGVAVRAPTGPIAAPRQQSLPYDAAADATPYEERSILDPARLGSFGDRVAEAMAGLVERPLAAAMATDLVHAAHATSNLGATLSRARRLVEHRWGSGTLELPVSAVCDTAAFRRFAQALIADPPALHAAYNGSLAAYRAAHRLRTPAQPLPNLRQEDDWWEAPFWVWSADDPIRRPLFIQIRDGDARLSNRAGGEWLIDRNDWVSGLADLWRRGVKVRSRALITTLYTRLFLGDLFLHGIGGAKYDQVTDDFARRLAGFPPPPHATLTATLRLPIDYPAAPLDADQTLRQRLRELRFHPERFVDGNTPQAAPLVAEKAAAVEVAKVHGVDAARHQQIAKANLALQPMLAEQREALVAQQAADQTQRQAAAVLGSREYSFCLFPESDLRHRLQGLAK